MDRILPNVPNFRMLPGTNIYRSSKPDRMKDEDIEITRGKLGIKTIIDLRSTREVRKPSLVDKYYLPFSVISTETPGSKNLLYQPMFTEKETVYDKKQLPESHKHFIFDLLSKEYFENVKKSSSIITLLFLGLLSLFDAIFKTHICAKYFVLYVINTRGIVGQYKDTIQYCGKQLVTVLRTMTDPDNMPCMICCAYGKDRTGILSALILALLGCSKESIAEDYSKSKEEILAIYSELEADLKAYSLNSTFATANFETMMELLHFIDSKYGSILNYLSSIGFTAEEQRILCAIISQR